MNQTVLVTYATFGALSLSVWGFVVYRQWILGLPLIEAEPRRDIPWRGTHVSVAFVVWLMLQLAGELAIRWKYSIAADEPLPTDNLEVKILGVAAFSFASVGSAILIGTYLKIDLKASLRDMGWSSSNIGRDVMTGILAFLAIVPVVLTINLLLMAAYRLVTGEDPAAHPIARDSQLNPSPQLLIGHAFSAVLVAPVVEEFIFRGVLQGWLEKLARATRPIEAQREHQDFAATSEPDSAKTPEQKASLAAVPADEQAPATATDGKPDESIPEPPMIAPIIVSSLFFSFFHWGHGVAPVSLFFLSLVLGYLYQRTHRLLPSLIVHMGLNGLSMATLWYVTAGKAVTP